MDETQLLIFRWRDEEFGVPVEDVIGIIRNIGTNRMGRSICVEEIISLQGKSILIPKLCTDLDAVDNKLTLIMYSNGAQIAIMVDEIINVKLMGR